jgi:predicted house-cleaning noncanonical NTP pyrophosphatase (MazG superfamily)
MKLLEFLKDKRNILIIIGVVIILIIALLLIFNNKKDNKEDGNNNNDVKEVESSEYAKLFEDKGKSIVVEYLQSQNCSYDEASEIVSRINEIFGTNIKLLNKSTITQSVFESSLNSNKYSDWTSVGDVVAIEDGKIIKQDNLYDVFDNTELENTIIYIMSESKLLDETKIKGLLNEISLDDYLNKIKSETSFYVFANEKDIHKSLYAIYAFGKNSIDFYYLDTASMSKTNLNRLYASNEKFQAMTSNKSLMIYVINKDNIEFTNLLDTYQIELFIDETKEIQNDIGNGSVDEYNFMSLIGEFFYLPSTSITDFASYNDYTLKARMVLDKIDFVDKLVLIDNNIYYVSKDLFDKKAKELFGDNEVIDITNLGDLPSGNSCALWKYNTTNNRFERGENGCGGDDGMLRQIISNTLSNNDSSYVLETREAYIDTYNAKIYRDSEHKDLLVTVSEPDEDLMNAAVEQNKNGLYTRKYIFTKTSDGYYLKSYEVIK